MKEVVLIGVSGDGRGFIELGKGEYDESNPMTQTFVLTSDLHGFIGMMVEIKDKKEEQK